MNPLAKLADLGTSVWVDGLVPPAELQRLAREDSVTGLTRPGLESAPTEV